MPILKRKRNQYEGDDPACRAARQTDLAPAGLAARRRRAQRPIANGKENTLPGGGEAEADALKPSRDVRRSDWGPEETNSRRVAATVSGSASAAGDGGLSRGARCSTQGHALPAPSVARGPRGPGAAAAPVPAPPTVSHKHLHPHPHVLSQGAAPERPRNERIDRNIDKVVLGNICFPAWYPSYYGKDVLGDGAGNKDEGHGKTNGRKERDKTPVLDRLYVCPCCFKYSKELVTWWEHVRVCEREGCMPGRKIYVHPKGPSTVLVPSSSEKQARGLVEEEAQDQGEWSVWEVKGDKHVVGLGVLFSVNVSADLSQLFCQNLSLFAKLFLDNKSVFFDVTGFNYYLLVYTPPAPSRPDAADTLPQRGQVVGFFSKEKMSWDNNNLACILVFPPWQRKGLGALLMGVSYEISRREGLVGGPEKPISDLGKRGYKRFWAGEIARWLLRQDVDDASQGRGTVTVEQCSKSTCITVEDCLVVLRDINIAQDVGRGARASRVQALSDADQDVVSAGGGVQTVRIDKEAVRRWVKANGVSLEAACHAEGFVDGYFGAAASTPAS